MSDLIDELSIPEIHGEVVQAPSCELLGPTALVVQALMGVFVLLSLIYKRHRESIKRPWKIWAFDVSKQVFGQMFIHGFNLLVSGLGAHHSSRNPCALYFLNVLIDTTLGVGVIYAAHHGLTYLFVELLHFKGCTSGYYGRPPKVSYWIRQAAIYVVALTSMKLLVVSLFTVYPSITSIGDWLLSWIAPGSLQVIFVMGLFPITMNIIQFWLIDSIVKAASQETDPGISSSPRLPADREPLFSANASEDGSADEGCSETRVHDIENPEILRSHSASVEIKSSTVRDDIKSISSRRIPDTDATADECHDYPPSSSSSPGHSIRSRSTTPRTQEFLDLQGSDDMEVASSRLIRKGQNVARMGMDESLDSPQSLCSDQGDKRTKLR